jgi:MFS family permease
MSRQRWKLCVMMFLQFFIWGAWFPLIFGYLPSLNFNEWEQGWILGAFNLAAFTAMFFSTQFADRNFSAERFLAFSMLVAGVAMFALFWVEPGWTVTVSLKAIFRRNVEVNLSFWAFFLLMLVHSLFYVPTISITNSIAFAHLRDPQKEFGFVRLWGTIGWIAASWPFVFILADWAKIPALGQVSFAQWLGAVLGTSKTGPDLRQATTYTFLAAGVASLVLALFSLCLPHTPPRRVERGTDRFAWLEAMKLLAVPFVLVLFFVTFFDAGVHQCYFFWTGRYLEKGVGIPGNWVMPVMSIGQVAEVSTMAFLGYVLKRLGWRYTMVIGVLGHAARFLVFAYFPIPWVAVTINMLHGICYAFFFATVYIFVDEFFPKDARSSAQGLFNFLILGAGPFVGNFVWAQLGKVYAVPPDSVDFRQLFLVPAAVALGAAVFLLLFFHPPAKAAAERKVVAEAVG